MTENAELEARVAALERWREAQEARRVSARDRELAPALLEALWFAEQGQPFALAEVTDPAAMAAIRVAGGLRCAGRLLRRCEGTTLDGLRAVRLGKDRDGVVWAVVRA